MIITTQETSRTHDQADFNLLMRDYLTVVSTKEKNGLQGQSAIDAEYTKLSQFIEAHPEFISQRPPKYTILQTELHDITLQSNEPTNDHSLNLQRIFNDLVQNEPNTPAPTLPAENKREWCLMQ